MHHGGSSAGSGRDITATPPPSRDRGRPIRDANINLINSTELEYKHSRHRHKTILALERLNIVQTFVESQVPVFNPSCAFQ